MYSEISALLIMQLPTVMYNVNKVNPDDAAVLEYITEEFYDHLGRNTDPLFTFLPTYFNDLGDNSTYKA